MSAEQSVDGAGRTAAAVQPGHGIAGLGRFTPDGDGAAMVEVRLLNLPLHVMKASREHHDGLMRELRLLALSGQIPTDHPPARLLEIVAVLGEKYGAARERSDAQLDAAIAAGLEVLDQVETVPAAAAQAAVGLDQMIRDADAYCEQAMLITLPRPPVVRRFGEWYISQFVDQVAGADPVPWDGPLRVEG